MPYLLSMCWLILSPRYLCLSPLPPYLSQPTLPSLRYYLLPPYLTSSTPFSLHTYLFLSPYYLHLSLFISPSSLSFFFHVLSSPSRHLLPSLYHLERLLSLHIYLLYLHTVSICLYLSSSPLTTSRSSPPPPLSSDKFFFMYSIISPLFFSAHISILFYPLETSVRSLLKPLYNFSHMHVCFLSLAFSTAPYLLFFYLPFFPILLASVCPAFLLFCVSLRFKICIIRRANIHNFCFLSLSHLKYTFPSFILSTLHLYYLYLYPLFCAS